MGRGGGDGGQETVTKTEEKNRREVVEKRIDEEKDKGWVRGKRAVKRKNKVCMCQCGLGVGGGGGLNRCVTSGILRISNELTAKTQSHSILGVEDGIK